MRKFVLPILVVIVLVGLSVAATKVQWTKASGTIYIKADGSIEGTVKIVTSDNVTYTFIGDINDTIMVLRSNITIDGRDLRLMALELDYIMG